MIKETHFREGVPPQACEIVASNLEPQELSLVLSVISWKNPSRWESLLRETHGRSLVFQSPDRPFPSSDQEIIGNFSGLQIIGAGGSKKIVEMIKTGKSIGTFPTPKLDLIEPTDPENHSKTMDAILQLRKFDEQGNFVNWQREYAPLHGMDIDEAVKRKTMTQFLKDFIQDYHQETGRQADVVVPGLVAEALFPNKLDSKGNPLQVQVYRVPLAGRFAEQLDQYEQDGGYLNVLKKLGEFSFFAGRAFKLLHNLDLAYMDGHPGNMSLLSHRRQRALYITDLGSMQNLKEVHHQNKYKAFDLLMFFEALNQFFPDYLQSWSGPKEQVEFLEDALYGGTLYGLTAGYFESAIIAKDKEINFADFMQATMESEQAEKLWVAMMHYTDTQNRVDLIADLIQSNFPA